MIATSPGQAAVSDADAAQGIIECSESHLKKHNPDLAGKPDKVLCFLAYVSNFNTRSRQIGGKPRFLGVPHWVVHHIAKAENAPETKDRPNSWFTVPDLAKQGIAPTDDSYAFSKAFREKNKNWYERGHLAQKYLAERLGEIGLVHAQRVNAVPQRSRFNKGPWSDAGMLHGRVSDECGEVWVVAGPVYRKNKPVVWLKSDANKKGAAGRHTGRDVQDRRAQAAGRKLGHSRVHLPAEHTSPTA